jgi:hypothetical protein
MPSPNAQLPAQNIITDQGVYPFSALLVVIKRLIAALFGAGASTVVWRPGGVSSGNVFATWAEVVAAVAALNGDITIAVDMDLAPAVIPAGAWNLRPAGVSGPVSLVAAGRTTPYYLQFVTIANAAVSIHGLTRIDGVQVVNQSTVDVVTISVAAGEGKEFTLDGYAAIYQSVLAGAAHAFLRVIGFNGALTLRGSSFISTLDGGTNAVQVNAASFLQLLIDDFSGVDTNQLVAPAGTAIVCISGDVIPPFVPYGTQAGAPTIIPSGFLQKGSAAIVVGTGKTAAIPVILSATSSIVVTQKTPVGDALTVKYSALAADRVNGAPGSFQITAVLAAGGGAVNGADTSTIDWYVKN